jgi:DNA modification methylase
VAINSLHPHPRNYRAHPVQQVAAIAESLRLHGQYRNVVVQASTGYILAGHGVVEAARSLGWTKVQAVFLEVDDAQALRLLVDDNELPRLALDDSALLANILGDLVQLDLPPLAYAPEEIEALLAAALPPPVLTEDDPPEPQAEAVSRTGDLWLLGDHRLLAGDCTVAADVEKLVGGGERASMCWTDPPYGVNYQNHGHPSWGKHEPIANDNLDDEGMATLWGKALTLAATVCTGDLYVAAPPGPPMTILDDTVRDRTPYERHQWLVWVKNSLVLGRTNYHYRHEQILYGWPKGRTSSWAVGRDRDSIFEVNRPSRSEEHPTMKPVELVAQMVENSSRRGDGVYDPFSGSGTTLLACEQLGRRFLGIEIEPRYVDVICRRYFAATGREALLEATGRTFAQTEKERMGKQVQHA